MKYWRKPLVQHQENNAVYQVHVLKDRCKGCRFCIEFCPRHVLEESADFNTRGYHPVYAPNNAACLNCGLCERICPEFAIRVTPLQEEEARA